MAAGLWVCQSVSFSTSLTEILLVIRFLWKRGKGSMHNTKTSCCRLHCGGQSRDVVMVTVSPFSLTEAKMQIDTLFFSMQR